MFVSLVFVLLFFLSFLDKIIWIASLKGNIKYQILNKPKDVSFDVTMELHARIGFGCPKDKYFQRIVGNHE